MNKTKHSIVCSTYVYFVCKRSSVYTLLDFVIGFLSAFVLCSLIACGYNILFFYYIDVCTCVIFFFYKGAQKNFHSYSVLCESQKLSSSMLNVMPFDSSYFFFFSVGRNDDGKKRTRKHQMIISIFIFL